MSNGWRLVCGLVILGGIGLYIYSGYRSDEERNARNAREEAQAEQRAAAEKQVRESARPSVSQHDYPGACEGFAFLFWERLKKSALEATAVEDFAAECLSHQSQADFDRYCMQVKNDLLWGDICPDRDQGRKKRDCDLMITFMKNACAR